MNHENAPWGVQEGDRIRLVAPMKDDPCPIEVGDEGIVTRITPLNLRALYGGGDWQIAVDWKSGRSLGITVPPDEFEIIRPDTCKWCKQDIWPSGRDEDGAEWMNAEGEVVCSSWAQDCTEDCDQLHSHEAMTIDDEVIDNLDLMHAVAERTRETPPNLASALDGLRSGGTSINDDERLHDLGVLVEELDNEGQGDRAETVRWAFNVLSGEVCPYCNNVLSGVCPNCKGSKITGGPGSYYDTPGRGKPCGTCVPDDDDGEPYAKYTLISSWGEQRYPAWTDRDPITGEVPE